MIYHMYMYNIKIISASVTLTKQKGSIRGGISISIISIGISIIMILSSIISIRQHCFSDWNSELLRQCVQPKQLWRHLATSALAPALASAGVAV